MISDMRQNLDLIIVVIVAVAAYHLWQKSRGKKGAGS